MTTTHPQWSATDDTTADLLTVLADDGTLGVEAQWDLYVACAEFVAFESHGAIDPNQLRLEIAGRIKPQRVGAFTHRALRAGLIEYTGRYVISTDTKGRNSGKPCRELRWIGGQS